MRLISSYNKKWLVYSVLFFTAFSSVLILIEYRHEKHIRVDALNNELDNYTGLINNYLLQNRLTGEDPLEKIDSLASLMPDTSLRITVIENDGVVVYDSYVNDEALMENHLYRPEIKQALNEGTGTDIRVSSTTGKKYYYFARRFDRYIVRASEIYDINLSQLIQPDLLFLFFVIFILFITTFTILIISDKFGESVETLRDFTSKVLENKPLDDNILFPRNELGAIGKKIIDIYVNLNNTKKELLIERAKLIRHLNMLEEGVAVFSPDKEVIMKNAHFLLYLNHISENRLLFAEQVFDLTEFYPLNDFLQRNSRLAGENQTNHKWASDTSYEISISKEGRHFTVKCVIFDDRSFEISIQDVTKPARRKILKQELTENIAHELKTPVSSIRGLLETVLEGNPDREKANDFLRRAYAQSCRLTELIDDISLLTKIEDAGRLYKIEEVNVNDIISEIAQELQSGLKDNDTALQVKLGENLTIRGNTALIYAIFRNLTDNVINHAGQGTTIVIEKFLEDSENYYFSFTDNGLGVPEPDLPRLFERFYRVDKGRDRKKGGTGLGLSIVKNAVIFHKGTISVKNAPGGGLQFLFSISKSL